MGVTAFAFLVPDLIDKPLWILGAISDGRFIGHTLVVAAVVALAFSLKKRVYGLFAICGSILHLLLDIRGFVPWFYPFKDYNFPSVDYHGIITWYAVMFTLLELAVVLAFVCAGVSLILILGSWVRGRRHPEARAVSRSANSMHAER